MTELLFREGNTLTETNRVVLSASTRECPAFKCNPCEESETRIRYTIILRLDVRPKGYLAWEMF